MKSILIEVFWAIVLVACSFFSMLLGYTIIKDGGTMSIYVGFFAAFMGICLFGEIVRLLKDKIISCKSRG